MTRTRFWLGWFLMVLSMGLSAEIYIRWGTWPTIGFTVLVGLLYCWIMIPTYGRAEEFQFKLKAYDRARRRTIFNWGVAKRADLSDQYALGYYHGLDKSIQVLAQELSKDATGR